jgi:aspartate/methionine/tyrosine aminotransferase
MFASRTGWDLKPNRFTLALENHQKSGRPLLDLTASNPTSCGFAYQSDTLLTAFQHPEALNYEPEPRGLLSARRSVADYYSAKSLNVSPENIILTTSTSEAYSFIFRLLCDPGDELLLPQPSYPLFQFLADLHDVRLAPYSLVCDHAWQIDFSSLRNAITPRTRAIILVNPNNPTGSFTKASELQELNAICAQHQLAIISDEVFHDYSFLPATPLSFSTNHAVLTFTLSGLSKVAGLPQMKVAWMVVSGPAALRQAALDKLDVIADTFLSMNAPMQHALPTLLDSRHHFQTQLNSRLRANLKALDGQLAQQKVCARFDVEGGWYAILRVPVTRTDEDLAIALLEQHHVLVHPGHFFDFEQEGYLVLSLMTPEDVFLEGSRKILQFLSN